MRPPYSEGPRVVGYLAGADADKNFKRPKNREDSSDLDENLSESIAALQAIISKILVAPGAQKKCFRKNFKMIELIAAINSVQKSSQSELSSRFFGRLNFFFAV